ncbi:rhodanese-related sulfurtransferase [Rhodobacteraceae bacterium CCMM004]|nr:rhodanese-related sulfurtransferase [Rhodobacteraceae bacterium CCMM004]
MIAVAAFYRFAPLRDPGAVRGPLRAVCAAQGVRGSVLLAPEGINGTIAGSRDGIDAVLAHLRALPGFAALEVKDSVAPTMPFGRLKVRLKREIVTFGRPVNPVRAGTYVDPCDWNALIATPDVAVIDTRNAYEVAAGTFRGAVDPGTRAFGDFPDWWAANAGRFADTRIAMFCTGGIRCEKATAWLRAQGVPEVYHLKGGILGYLRDVPEEESLWRGECFVFDGRVAVGHGLRPGTHVLCPACRGAVGPQDRAHPHYEEGVQCPACSGTHTETQLARFRERHRQMRLAAVEGRRHLGA